MASFRRSNADSRRGGQFGGGGSVAGSPFSQAQILHLMKTEFARARRYGFPVSCMLMQIDRLEALVDLHGGVLREMVRQELGKLVQEKTRGADHLGFASDDRYLVVLPHTSGDAALKVAERLGRAFQAIEFQVGTSPFALRLSIGVAGCHDQATLFFDTMLTQAEAALEHAALDGGNHCALFRKDRVGAPDAETDETDETDDTGDTGEKGETDETGPPRPGHRAASSSGGGFGRGHDVEPRRDA